MFAALTGIGLSASAGLNAWIPLLMIGLLDRFTNLISVPPAWHWMSNGWVLTIFAGLLVVEMIADKIPVLDSVNDAIHTFIRPTAGGIAFGATSGAQTVTVQDPGTFLSSHTWVPIVSGAAIALVMHGMKAAIRPIANTLSFGAAAPVLSTAEDATSVTMSLVAIVLPVLIIVFLVVIVIVFFQMRKTLKRRRAAKKARSMSPGSSGPPQGYTPIRPSSYPTTRQYPTYPSPPSHDPYGPGPNDPPPPSSYDPY